MKKLFVIPAFLLLPFNLCAQKNTNAKPQGSSVYKNEAGVNAMSMLYLDGYPLSCF